MSRVVPVTGQGGFLSDFQIDFQIDFSGCGSTLELFGTSLAFLAGASKSLRQAQPPLSQRRLQSEGYLPRYK